MKLIGEEMVFEEGDEIEVELHRGSDENDEGISSGGGWTKPARGFVKVMECDRRYGWLVNARGQVIQAMSLVEGEKGYPYRNSKFVRSATEKDEVLK